MASHFNRPKLAWSHVRSKSHFLRIVGLGSGLTLLTQSGMADASYNAYCWIMGLQLSVPFLSWALISGGGYAFSQMASSLTQSSENFAAKVGSEVVDGNVSFDTQSIGNRSLANSQIAQQQLSPSFNTSMRFDDGKLSLLHGPNGSVVAQEHLSTFGTNITRNDAFSQIASLQRQFSLSTANQESISMQDATTVGTTQMVSFIKSAADSTSIGNTFGHSDASSLQKQAQHLLTLAENISTQQGVSTDVAFNAAVQASMGAGLGFGFKAGVDGNAGFSAGSRDSELAQKIKESALGNQFNESLQRVIQYTNDHKATLSETVGTQHLDQAQESFNIAKTHAQNKASHLNQADSWNNIVSTGRNSGTSSTTNANNDLLDTVAQRFGGNRQAAAEYIAKHPKEAEIMGKSMVNATTHHPSALDTSQEVRTIYDQDKAKFEAAPSHDNLQQLNIEGRTQKITNEANKLYHETIGTLQKAVSKLHTQEKDVHDERTNLSKTISSDQSATLIGRTIHKGGENLGDWGKKVIQKFETSDSKDSQ